MEDLYSIHPSIPRSPGCNHDRSAPSTLSRPLRAQITGHPLYPSLVSAYIDCRKVGAPPELASQLEELGRENHASARRRSEIGVDPELDDFMESYCEVLRRYKEELSKPLDEATCFLSRVEMELNDLCRSSTSVSTVTTAANADSSTGAGGSSEEHVCREGEASDSSKASLEVGDLDLKEKLLQKYSGYLSSLRNEFLKKRKKGKLPKDSRLALLDWWNAHYRWPYPTEEEKATLVEMTGLDQRQINNWFINQRKRHWKPSEDMQSALMEGLGSGASETETQLDTGTTDP